MDELKTTPLNELQREARAKLVPFAGWEMPVNFGSQIAEHQAVRESAGMFDVSHITQVDITGADAEQFLRYLLVGDVAKLEDGRALYSLTLTDEAGVLDDLMVYRTSDRFRVVFNASTRDKLTDWLDLRRAELLADVQFRDDLAMLAIQGPEAINLVNQALGEDFSKLAKFGVTEVGEMLVARTGYTGEDGLEFMLPGANAQSLWTRLSELGVQCCGLGARDTLRLEAGLNLYGQDMDETTHPLESRLGWTIAWSPQDRDFIGRRRLQEIADAGSERELKGIALLEKGVIRSGTKIETQVGAGEVTSGSFSPTLGYSIGFARVPAGAKGDVQAIIRGVTRKARLVSPRFLSMARRDND